jgi:hypothetical protein
VLSHPEALITFLATAGFKITTQYRDWHRILLTPTNDDLIILIIIANAVQPRLAATRNGRLDRPAVPIAG